MRLIGWSAVAMSVAMAATMGAAQAPGAWDQPTAVLADKVAAILGPGQARLTLRNLSTISPQELPSIRQLFEEDLKQHGVGSAGSESANAIRVTLSENARERIWIAEVVEGNVTQVAMVEAGPTPGQRAAAAGGLSLRRQTLLTTHEPVLAALEMASSLVVLEPEQVVLYTRAQDGWREWKRVSIGQKQPLPRDARGTVNPDPDGTGFHAWLAGAQCMGSLAAGDWTVSCHPSDDPWPVNSAQNANRAPGLSAFYNPARNYFTGVVTPNLGVDLPRFYASAWIPRSSGTVAYMVGGIDGKVQILENAALKPIAGTRDWGSDFTVLRSGCGTDWQIIASGSGQAASDSLRAYELPALEVIPASMPLELAGTVTALSSSPDEKNAIAIVRGRADTYEVDRVTALCN
ncbi:MAG TPA: hypothetical protein VK764_13315 [Terracidiphilus sp.]|nr:hypothetical protein [Terracidiphilus sp.]